MSPEVPRSLRVAVTLTQCWHHTPGGTATAALDLVGAIEAGGRVEVVGIGPRSGEPTPGFEPSVPVRRLPLPVPYLYDAWNLLERPRVVPTSGPVDLIHATAPVFPPDRNVPVVATLNDLFPVTHPERFTARGRFVMGRALRRTRERARLVIVPSEATARDARDFGIEPDRIRVVPYGVSVPERPSDAAVGEVRRRLGLPERFVLWVGTLEPRKNLPVVLDAFAVVAGRHRDVGLVLVGPRGWGVDLDDRLAGLGPRVHAPGFLPAGDLDALYRACSAFVYPSLAEGFGLPVLEAMGRGAAVVTSAGTSTEEVAGDAGRCVDPTSVDAVACALDELLTDPSAAAALGERARSRALGFTWAACAERTVAAYAEAVDR